MNTNRLLILSLCLVMLATVAVAREVPTVTRIDPADLQDITVLTPPGDGFVGNLNPPVYSVAPWFTGAEAYKYFFNPSEQIPNCTVGFQLTAVHMYLQFEADLVFPIDFPVYGDLETAVWDPTLACYVPGPEECVGPEIMVTIEEPGLYDIEVPMDCACAYLFGPDGMPFMYMISMHYPIEFTAKMITDDIPVPCTSWNNYGDGWIDLVVDFNFPGGTSMYGDILCCTDPVSVEVESWGDIKSLFR